jgi:hypothetical protein
MFEIIWRLQFSIIKMIYRKNLSSEFDLEAFFVGGLGIG